MTKLTIDHVDHDGAAISQAALTTHAGQAANPEGDTSGNAVDTATEGDTSTATPSLPELLATLQTGDAAAQQAATTAYVEAHTGDKPAGDPPAAVVEPVRSEGESKKAFGKRLAAWRLTQVTAATAAAPAKPAEAVEGDKVGDTASALETALAATPSLPEGTGEGDTAATPDLPRTMPTLVSMPAVIKVEPATPLWAGGFDLSGWGTMATDTTMWPTGAPPCPDTDAVHMACAVSAGDPDNGVAKLSQPHTKKVLSIACYLTQAMPQHLTPDSTFNVFDWGAAMHLCRSLGAVCGTTADHKQNASLDAARAGVLVIDKTLSVPRRFGQGGGRGIVYRNHVSTSRGTRLVERYFTRINRPLPLWFTDYAAALVEFNKASVKVDAMAQAMGAANTKGD